jgi:hypothetical protein
MPFVHNKVKKGLMCVLGKGGRDLIYICVYMDKSLLALFLMRFFFSTFFLIKSALLIGCHPTKKLIID